MSAVGSSGTEKTAADEPVPSADVSASSLKPKVGKKKTRRTRGTGAKAVSEEVRQLEQVAFASAVETLGKYLSFALASDAICSF